MSDSLTTETPTSTGVSGWAVAGGILFILLWLAAGVVAVSMGLLAGLMANDSGAASNESHMSFLGGSMLGIISMCIAGVPAGLAFFMRGKRKVLLFLFVGLLLGGFALLVMSVNSFLSLPELCLSGRIDA